LGRCYTFLKKYDKAIINYRKYISLGGRDFTTYKLLAECFSHMKKYREATRYYKLSLEKNPKSTEIYLSFAVNLIYQGDLTKAKGLIRRAIRLDKQSATAYKYLGFCLMNQRKYGEATKYFQKSLRIQPEDPYTNLNYGYLLLFMKMKVEMAIPFLKKACLFPKEKKDWSNLGKAYYNLATGTACMVKLDFLKAQDHFRKSADYFRSIKKFDEAKILQIMNLMATLDLKFSSLNSCKTLIDFFQDLKIINHEARQIMHRQVNFKSNSHILLLLQFVYAKVKLPEVLLQAYKGQTVEALRSIRWVIRLFKAMNYDSGIQYAGRVKEFILRLDRYGGWEFFPRSENASLIQLLIPIYEKTDGGLKKHIYQIYTEIRDLQSDHILATQTTQTSTPPPLLPQLFSRLEEKRKSFFFEREIPLPTFIIVSSQRGRPIVKFGDRSALNFEGKTLEFAIFLMLATHAKYQPSLSVPKAELGIGKKDHELDSLRSILEYNDALESLGYNRKQRRELVETVYPKSLRIAIEPEKIEIKPEAYKFKSTYPDVIAKIRRQILKENPGSIQISDAAIQQKIKYLKEQIGFLQKKQSFVLNLKQKAHKIWLKSQNQPTKK
jgi:tetratricopeptide (TPR) repeat protein